MEMSPRKTPSSRSTRIFSASGVSLLPFLAVSLYFISSFFFNLVKHLCLSDTPILFCHLVANSIFLTRCPVHTACHVFLFQSTEPHVVWSLRRLSFTFSPSPFGSVADLIAQIAVRLCPLARHGDHLLSFSALSAALHICCCDCCPGTGKNQHYIIDESVCLSNKRPASNTLLAH